MKNALFFLLVLSGLSCMNTVSDKIETDVKLVALKSALPKGWEMTINSDILMIQNPEPIWELHSNFINAPLTDLKDDDVNKKKIIENGKKTNAHFTFQIKELKALPKTERAEANYTSKKYALYELSTAGFDTPYIRNYPWNIEEEAAHIYYVTIIENLTVVKGPVYPEIH